MNGRVIIGLAAFLAVLFCLLFPPLVGAQIVGGTISGTMTDQSGAVIPGVVVVIRNVGTGGTRTLTTNETGFYSAPNLLPGLYEITAEATTFTKVQMTGITVTVGSAQVINLKMLIRTLSEQVQVIDKAAPAVDTASSVLSHVVEGASIRELPLNGRDWTQLATLQPGVTEVRGHSAGGTQTGNGMQMTISGGRPSENNYRLNGISINDYANAGPGSTLGINLGVDAIQEFSVLTSTYSAEYGRTSGGVINAIMRSGTNALHGSQYYFHRNSALDARNFFDRGAVAPFRRHQFGASVGGPIKKDRTFFFSDYEGLRQFLAVSMTSPTLSQAARDGQLSTGPVTVDPLVKPYLGIYPLPNGGLLGKGDTGNFIFQSGRVSRDDFVTARLDHRISDKDILNGSYFLDDAYINEPDEYNNKAVTQASRRQTVTLEESHAFTPQVMNALRVGFTRTMAGNGLSWDIYNPILEDRSLGFMPGRAVGRIQIAGLATFTAGLDGIQYNIFRYNSYQAYDDIFVTKGIHALKFGANIERMQDNYDAPYEPNGLWVFNSISGFLTNRPSQLQAQLPDTDSVRGIRQTIFGVYIQDDVRWRPNLTLNLGLRYEMSTVPSEQHGRIANLKNLTDLAPTVGFLFNNNTLRNFAPRVGFAWDPFSDGKTSVRAGVGMFDVLPLLYIFVNKFNRTPPWYKTGYVNVSTPGLFPKGAVSLLTPATYRTIHIENSPKRSYKAQWNLNVQRELTRTVAVTAGYVGARGIHLPREAGDNDIAIPTITPAGYYWAPTAQRINPNFGRIASSRWNGDSNYHSLQMALKTMMRHGLQTQLSYTWAKSIDNASHTFSDSEYQNTNSAPYAFDLSLNRGLSDFDIRHAFVFNFQWEIPTPASLPAAPRALLGGWQLGGIANLTSGLPFNVILNSDRANTKSTQSRENLGQRPNYLLLPGCENPTNPGNPDHFVKTECFAFPALGYLGNLGRNTLQGPSLRTLDFSLFKNHSVKRISESFKVQFRAEFFNALNHTNLRLPGHTQAAIFDGNGNITGNAGQITQTQTTSRQIQFGMKIIW